VLDEEKKPLGVMSLSDALKLAQQKGWTWSRSPQAQFPPVCRIVDYGKFRLRAGQERKAFPKSGDKLKEITMSAVIDPHDFETKVAHAIDFLSSDIKVRAKLRFKGRQKAHKEFGFQVINRFCGGSRRVRTGRFTAETAW
jgi:translation initiation factor IF-3